MVDKNIIEELKGMTEKYGSKSVEKVLNLVTSEEVTEEAIDELSEELGLEKWEMVKICVRVLSAIVRAKNKSKSDS